MKTKKVTKRALLMSALALMICVSMLVGSTYAWFSDTVTSGGNIIKSGTLDIDLGIKNDDMTNDTVEADGYALISKNPNKKAFDYDLWEPGYTAWVNAKVVNKGTLALKYTMRIVANGDVSDLANVIDVYYKAAEVPKPATRDLSGLTRIGTLAEVMNTPSLYINDYLLAKAEGATDFPADYATIALHMQESAGNEYQNLSIGTDFSLQILATQYTYEEDSFDDQYDAAAHLNFAPVDSASTFSDALSAGLSASLENDVTLGDTYQVSPDQDVVIDGNGNTLSSTNGTRVINLDGANDASVTLNDVVVDAAGKERAVSIYGSEDVEVNVNGSEVIAQKYAINLASNSPNAEINIQNSSITGWCAIQSWSPDATINVQNSTLTGINQWSGTSNAFGTIVVNAPATGNTFTFTNCRIESEQLGDQPQWFILLKQGATLIFENCTFVYNGQELTMDDLYENFNDYIAFTSYEAIENTHLVINGETIL